ncbi:MAG: DNA-methyltransferase, partial [Planctomycetota bacterium]
REDAVEGARRRIPDGAVDLIITDPPYGIDGHTLHKHYNRREDFVVDGYIEIPAAEYSGFSRRWIAEAERVLRPGGAIFLMSGYTRLRQILNALHETKLREVNHLVWKYNFGVNTTRKFVSSHYHILYCEKPGGRRTFNRFARFGTRERTEAGRSRLYADLEDVWVINRDYKPGRRKNKNELPFELLMKMIQYGSRPGDLVLDFFLGSFSTAVVAKGLDRDATGFELNPDAFAYGEEAVSAMERGSLLAEAPRGCDDRPARAGRRISDEEATAIYRTVDEAVEAGATKKEAVARAMKSFERGYWAIEKLLKKRREAGH